MASPLWFLLVPSFVVLRQTLVGQNGNVGHSSQCSTSAPVPAACKQTYEHLGYLGAAPYDPTAPDKLKKCEPFRSGFKFPSSFDARTGWPECSSSLYEIRDQGACLSCWAVATASALSDRYCIVNKGKKHFRFSDQHVMSCATNPKDPKSVSKKETVGLDCCAGSVSKALDFATGTPVVSGGPYGSDLGCLPYSHLPCNHTVGPDYCQPKFDESIKPTCPNQCEINGYDFHNDGLQLKDACAFSVSSGDLYDNDTAYRAFLTEVKSEIMTNGPVVGVFQLMKGWDTFDPQDGRPYEPLKDDQPLYFNHAIKLIGWHTNETTGHEYWLAANSFNYYWGNRGFFRIFSYDGKDSGAYYKKAKRINVKDVYVPLF